VEFDPAVTSYRALLETFFACHDPCRPKSSEQYKSVIFPHDDAQESEAREILAQVEKRKGHKVYTEIVRREVTDLTLAEGYHQKFELRAKRRIFSCFKFENDAELIDSSAAARANGYIGGGGSATDLELEIDSFGLTLEACKDLRKLVSY